MKDPVKQKIQESYTEQAIKLAIEGGYEGFEWNDSIEVEKINSMYAWVWGKSKLGESHGIPLGVICLDPAFWKCLGKGLGWSDRYYYCDACHRHHSTFNDCDCGVGNNQLPWNYHWHRFIDALAECKSAEDFFKGVIGKTI